MAVNKHANVLPKELLKRIMAVVLLPCPFQFGRWGQGPGEATLQLWTPGNPGLFRCGMLAGLRIARHFKSHCYCQSWKVESPRETFFLASPAFFTNPLTRQERKVSSPSRCEASGLSSSTGQSQMRGQEGKRRAIVRKELAFQRANLYCSLMSWSDARLVLLLWHLPWLSI